MPSFIPNEDQRKFLVSADWALNSHVARGTGRSTAMAITALRMAISGATVHLYDPSIIFTHGTRYSSHRYFRERVITVAREYFPEFEFEIHSVNGTLRCLGPRVQFSPVAADPEPVKEFEDDGSEENT